MSASFALAETIIQDFRNGGFIRKSAYKIKIFYSIIRVATGVRSTKDSYSTIFSEKITQCIGEKSCLCEGTDKDYINTFREFFAKVFLPCITDHFNFMTQFFTPCCYYLGH